MYSTLIDVSQLSALLGRPEVVILDCRFELTAPDAGAAQFAAGHIPGAQYAHLERDLSGRMGPTTGRHPLPDPERLAITLGRWGINSNVQVIAYDGGPGAYAARAWWLLRWAGLKDVRLLDGGLPLWTATGRALAAGPGEFVESGSVTLRGGYLPTVDIDEAGRYPARGTLLDARAAARYRGDEEPVDPRAGHIPGAVSAPATDNLRADGTFRSAEELAARFTALCGDRPVAVYCGSGITATHDIAALAVAGIEAALFPGSWSQWCQDPAREVATGA